ncbi:LRR receptor-like kinase [Quillaja saponaria]|uniref:LRR receptor-like kinase n=1 Tax=Quillaja saponaria TaxID=32244 RepID=A0AAD7LKH2_QUISA|nr:LRR receptor-like kinase [Quillaja saponaria]
MDKEWKYNRFKDRLEVLLGLVVIWFLSQNLALCWSLNDEGMALLKLKQRVQSDPFDAFSNWIDEVGEVDPCSWFGVECSDGKVVVLDLRDLCVKGTLAPELADLVHLKSIILRNNFFSGIIPEEIGELKELEILDLGFNNFSGSLPLELGNNLSLGLLLLDNNELLGGLSPEINALIMLSEFQVAENQLSNAAKMSACTRRSITQHAGQDKDPGHRRLLQAQNNETTAPPLTDPPTHLPSPTPSPSQSPSPSPSHSPSPSQEPNSVASPSPSSTPAPSPSKFSRRSAKSSSKHHKVAILGGVIGGTLFVLVSITVIYLCKTDKVATVRPWATGLSGQLQKAFVTGVPKLKRSELEAACEDFSNVISTSSNGTVYKGTLSSGVEIAVASIPVTSARNWSKSLELQFRKKRDTLSKVNHKNFVNLVGYCKEEDPFTRMLVFEYAPNGSLFEHLHIKEAEHLDWETRLRIAMGMAYCLQHMHQLDPPISHSNLNSSAVKLAEDYAAKVSDLSLSNEIATAKIVATGKTNLKNAQSTGPESNIYSFGVILFEIVTGRLPYSVDNGSHEDWAEDYLRWDRPLNEMVDPTLNSFKEEQLVQIAELIKSCVHLDPQQRRTMKEVSERLKEITGITADGASPKLSPLWWAELEILSAGAS